ncbi:MAG: flavin reductase [Pirellulales bacterium]|nr:flavin reductase [Pirellulales bacterium]
MNNQPGGSPTSPRDPLPALGRVPSGIYILTAGRGEQATGMLASWAMQAGFEPPMVTVAVRQGRYVADWLSRGESFVLNIVGQGQKHLLKHFSAGFELGEPAFEGVRIGTAELGAPTLADALGYLECQPRSHVDSGDHRVFLAEVVGGSLTADGAPMVHIRKTGAHY